MKKILFALVLLCFAKLSCQEIIIKKQLPESLKVKMTFQVTNSDNDEMALFFVGNKKIFSSLFNGAHEEIASFESEPFPKDYDIPFGVYRKSDNLFQIFLTNKGNDKFGLVEFDFGAKSSKNIDIDLELKKETFLQPFKHNGKLHVLSIEDKSSVLNFYVFDIDGNFTKKVVDLSAEKFRYWDNSFVEIYTLMNAPFGKRNDQMLVKIDASTPNSLETSAAASKLFLEEDAFYLTFESNRNITQIVRIDPESFESTFTVFNKPFIPNAPAWKKANSFLYEGKYLGISATTEMLKFEVKDYQTRELISSYSIEKNEQISFKNTPISIEGSIYRSKPREIENENRFLRDLSDSEIGVSIYSEGETYVVSIGSFEKQNIPIPIGIPIPIAQVGFINITGFAYVNIKTSNSTSFKSLFNQQFEHQKGDVIANSFDQIGLYLESLEEKNQLEDVFGANSKPVLGYLDKDNNYIVVKF